MSPSAPIPIPIGRPDSGCVTYSPMARGSESPGLLFEMDPFSWPRTEPGLAPLSRDEDDIEAYLYTFPVVPALPLSSLNNGQSKASTPFLSPSSSTSSSASQATRGIGCKVMSRAKSRKPLTSSNIPAAVVRANPAKRITGFNPCCPASIPSSFEASGKLTTSRPSPHRRHITIVGHPTWHRPGRAAMDFTDLIFVDDAADGERVSRFHRRRNFSSGAR